MPELRVAQIGTDAIAQVRRAAEFDGPLYEVDLDGRGTAVMGRLAGEKRYATFAVKTAAREDAIAFGKRLAGLPADAAVTAGALDPMRAAIKIDPRYVELFRQLAVWPGAGARAFPETTIKNVDVEHGTAEVTASSDRLDRHRERVQADGMVVPKPKRVPLVSSHQYSDLMNQIGDATDITRVDNEIVARPRWFIGMGNPQADWGYQLVKLGAAAFSIGFQPLEWEDADLSDEKTLQAVLDRKMPLRDHTKWELAELSQVIVPANTDAVQRMVHAGILTDTAAKALPAIDEPMSEAAQRAFAAALEQHAKGAGLMRKDDEQWKVAAAKGLPLDDDRDWDADRARRSLVNDDGEMGEHFTRAHLVHDAGHAEEPDAHFGPFAEVVDGELHANRKALELHRKALAGSKGGRKAAHDLPDDLDDDTKDDIQNVIDSYLGEADQKAAALGAADFMAVLAASGIASKDAGGNDGDEDWKVGGARGLPVDEDASWDAGEARKRLRGEDDAPSGRFRRAHILFDAKHADEFDAYKLPFADLKDGKLVAVKRALVAARQRLNQTDVPEAARAAATRFIDGYLGPEEDGKSLTVTLALGDDFTVAMEDVIGEAVRRMVHSFETTLKDAETRLSATVRDVAMEAAREAFGADTLASFKASDLGDAIAKGAQIIVDRAIARHKGNVDHWIAKP